MKEKVSAIEGVSNKALLCRVSQRRQSISAVLRLQARHASTPGFMSQLQATGSRASAMARPPCSFVSAVAAVGITRLPLYGCDSYKILPVPSLMVAA